MRLKKLSISGFKSFPRRTVIRFVPGVSAIVGPNGCGKSNIADAIRWVLGEQSPGRIRARHMDDLIYRGSDGRQAPFAEVALLMENNAGMAPPELAELPEIEVKRILYRSGDTRYLLNGKNCRLKDIHYLFMDTGAGTRAYSIIDQGQIGRYVEMGGDERRRMVEEAAGVSRFKARRRDALRRMRRAEENLSRLDDLVAELEKRKRGLARQAAVAKRFRELRERRERVETTLFRMRWERCVEGLAVLHEKRRDVSTGLVSLNASRAAVEMRLEEAVLDEAEAAEAVRKGTRLLEEAGKRLDCFQHEYEQQVRKKISAETRIEEFRKRGLESERRMAEAEQRVEEVRRELESEEERYAGIAERLSRATGEVDRCGGIVKGLRKEVEEARGRLLDAAARLAALGSEKRNAEAGLERLETRLARGKGELERLVQRLSDLEKEQGELEKRRGVLEGETGRLAREEQELSEGLDRAGRKLEAVEREAREVSAGKFRVSDRLAAIREAEKKRLRVPEAVRKILLDSDGVCGLLSDFVEVEPGSEQAVEALLGDFLHAVVVPGDAGVRELSGRHGGRGIALVPSECGEFCGRRDGDDNSSLPCSVFVDLPVEGMGREGGGCIRVSRALAGVCRAFLEDAAMGRDMKSASLMLRERGDAGLRRVATEQGDLFMSWGGVILGGGMKEESGLAVKNLIRRLERELRDSEAAERELSAERESVSRECRSLGRELEALLPRKKKAEGEYEAAVRRIAGLRPEIEGVLSRKSVIEYELEDAEREIRVLEEKLEAAVSALKAAGQEEKDAGDELAEKQGVLKRHEKRLGAGRGRLNSLRTEAAVCKNRIQERKREIGRLEDDIRRLEKEIVSRESMEQKLAGELERAVSEVCLAETEVKLRKEAVKAASDIVRQRKRAAERAAERVESQRAALDGLASTIRMEEKKLHGLDLEISGLDSDASFLEQALFEKYRKDIRMVEPCADEMDKPGMEMLEKEVAALSASIERTGPVNLAAGEEFEEISERLVFLGEQKADLLASIADLKEAVDRLARQCGSRFSRAMQEINHSLERVFPLLFEGGSAALALEKPVKAASETDRDSEGQASDMEPGVDFLVRLPGKKIRHLNLLSGGEKTMASIALIFALYFIKPCPFCILDEVDAPLDEANTLRFNRLLGEVAAISQVILITHNQVVMEMAETLYGVTMERKGVSKLVSINLDRAKGAA